MAISVECGACAYSFRVADHVAGKRGKCPRCGEILTVPKTAASYEPADAPPTSLVKPRAANAPKAALPRWMLPVAGGGVAVAVLLVVAIVILLVNRASMPESPVLPVASQSAASSTLASAHEELPATSPVTASEGVASRVAKNFDEAANAIVKFEIPLPNNVGFTGSGFLINERGWVATNNHVASQLNTAARVKFSNGQKVEIEGIVVAVPTRDLAIVKLKEVPAGSKALDIAYTDRPKIGMKVFTFGSPLHADFTLAQGIVSRVLTHGEYLNGRPSVLKAPADQLWIQTDAHMAPGNSGGPLLDEECRVLGVNTFVNPAAGFASHVKYLKELADTSPDQVTAIKPPPQAQPVSAPAANPAPGAQVVKIILSPASLKASFDAAAALDWKPQKPDDYKVFAELAMKMAACRQPKIAANLLAAADQIFAEMKTIAWTEERLNAINQFGVAQLAAPNQGAMFFGTVVAKASNGKEIIGLLVQAPNSNTLALAPATGDDVNIAKGSRVLVLGITVAQTTPLNLPGQPQGQQARHLASPYILPLK